MTRTLSAIALDFAKEAALLGVVLALFTWPAFAHQAPSGWSYAPSCCDNRDCAPVVASAVVATLEGWRVVLEAGEHPQVVERREWIVPYQDVRIRQSGDSEFHPCIHPISKAILCLYVPTMGF